MKNPLKGVVVWPVPEEVELPVTLFKDPRTGDYEDKEWTIAVEDVSTGKPRPLASANINLRTYASEVPTQTSTQLTLKPVSKKVTAASIQFTVSSAFIREGKAT